MSSMTDRLDGQTFISVVIGSRTIFDSLFSVLSQASIFRFSWTCKSCRIAVISYMRRAFDIDKHLSRFFRSPSEFRSLQARTGTLISGSSALQFMDRTLYPDSDLDIYVDRRFGREVGHWLLSEGYSYTQKTENPQEFDVAFSEFGMEPVAGITELAFRDPVDTVTGTYPFRGISRVFNFTKSTPSGARDIQLITATLTPLAIILYFHSTCVMNFISDRAAYSLYPDLTFEQRRSLVCATVGISQEEARDKYIDRGWAMIRNATHDEVFGRKSSMRSGMRHVGDRHCWTLNLPTTTTTSDIPINHTSPDPVTTNTWSLDYTQIIDIENIRYHQAEMSLLVVQAPFMQWRYTFKDDGYHLIWPLLARVEEIRLQIRSQAPHQNSDLVQYCDAEIHGLVRAVYALQEQAFQLRLSDPVT